MRILLVWFTAILLVGLVSCFGPIESTDCEVDGDCKPYEGVNCGCYSSFWDPAEPLYQLPHCAAPKACKCDAEKKECIANETQ